MQLFDQPPYWRLVDASTTHAFQSAVASWSHITTYHIACLMVTHL